MKVLWILMSPMSHYLNYHGRSGAGAVWIESIFDQIAKTEGIKLSICFPEVQEDNIRGEIIDDISYFTIKKQGCNEKRNQKRNILSFIHIYNMCEPDIIHVWGTEFPYNLDAVTAAEKSEIIDKVVLSLQGMCQAIARHYYAGLPNRIVWGYSIRDLLKHDNIHIQKLEYEKRSKAERETIQKVKYAIGRTDYDYAYTTIINRNLKYYRCMETIGDIFFENEWHYEKCNRQRILMSQGYYPLKGVHYVIEAFSLIAEKYPDAEICIAGWDIVRLDSKLGRLKGSKYANYLRQLIKRNGLEGRVRFIGRQDRDEMCRRYLESNVFISASTTENESNSLGEAKLLGMPVIASFVGGVCNRIKHREDGLAYQYDDIVMLARFICDIFDYPDYAKKLGKCARENELEISHRERNIADMIDVYKKILEYYPENVMVKCYDQ